jgi:hypothetical protein
MINMRLLSAWPNWVIIPTMIVLWMFAGVLVAELLGADPYTTE